MKSKYWHGLCGLVVLAAALFTVIVWVKINFSVSGEIFSSIVLFFALLFAANQFKKIEAEIRFEKEFIKCFRMMIPKNDWEKLNAQTQVNFIVGHAHREEDFQYRKQLAARAGFLTFDRVRYFQLVPGGYHVPA